jgi:hypothetical protein
MNVTLKAFSFEGQRVARAAQAYLA